MTRLVCSRTTPLAIIALLAAVAVPRLASAQPYRGSDALEPGLENRTDILLFEDFEEADWEQHWTQISHTENHDAVTAQAFQGSRSLEFRVPAGEHYGGALDFDFTDAGLEEPEEIYFRYYVRFTDSWELTSDGEIGKLPGFGGTYGVAGWGGRPSNGTDGWSARMMNWDRGSQAQVGFYTYHADMTGTYGDHMQWTPEQPRNEWICIEAYARMNTLGATEGNNDGVLRGWIDEAVAFEQTDLRFRHVDSLKIETIWFNIYVGGSWTADHDMTLYFDNVVVARNRIGCYSGDPSPPPPTGGAAGSSATGGSAGTASGGTPPSGGDGGAPSGGAGPDGGSGGSATGGSAPSGGSGGDATAGASPTGGSGGATAIGGATATGGEAGDGATVSGADDASDEGGCGCSVPAGRNGPASLASLSLLALVLLRRRRG